MSVQVELSRIYIREMSDIQIIELTELEGTRRFLRDDDDDRLPRFTHLITLVAS